MNLFIVLFFVSLVGIIFMIGRKLRLLGNGHTLPPEHASLQVPRFDEIHNTAERIMKRLGYFLLVEIIRVYVRLAEASKKGWTQLKARFQKTIGSVEEPSVKQPSKFLKAIAEYKHRIGKIKKEVKEEENL